MNIKENGYPRREIREQRKKKLQALEDTRRAEMGFDENNKWTFEKEALIPMSVKKKALDVALCTIEEVLRIKKEIR